VAVDEGYECRVVKKKPLLSPENVIKRAAWARIHLGWSAEWFNCIYSDETSFTLVPRQPREYVRTRGGVATAESYRPSLKHGGGKIMVWGCFSVYGTGPMKLITETMDKHVYHSILVHTAMPHMFDLAAKLQRENPSKPVELIFQQDNDPKHTAKINRRYLDSKLVHAQERKWTLTCLDWPSQSPDMNPIEHLWDYVKDQIAKRVKKPSNIDEL
jgi:hypothetical protein